MARPDKFNNSEVHRKMVNDFVDKTLDSTKCVVCKKLFITTKQRDQALIVGVEPIKVVHFECKDKV